MDLLSPQGLQLTRSTLDCIENCVGTLERSLFNYSRKSVVFKSSQDIFCINFVLYRLLSCYDKDTQVNVKEAYPIAKNNITLF